ncbi:MAG: ATP-dependent zinc metalloprotease FtsH [Candidatus Gracilibacteria bacterium]|nr:ATP-dependent zinc metalloprotease FtsH [Candidatus Gracilibacteria bacterium]MDD2908827.1 ATP-dependent zinc metalloprotease FtsH [Candidatus Gracilibacteria bacterium]
MSKKNKIDLISKLKQIQKLDNKKKSNKKKSNPFIVLFLVAIVISVLYSFLNTGPKEEINSKAGIYQVVSNYSSGKYKSISIEGNTLYATRIETKQTQVGNKSVETKLIDKVILPPNDSLADLGFNQKNNKTPIKVEDDTMSKFWSDFAPTIFSLVLFVIIAVVLFGKMSGGANGPMAFIKSRAKLYNPGEKDKITFKDVAGAEEEKDELIEVVDFLKNPKKYKDLGAKIPRGVLMVGPPGTGKTLLARAVAGESGVPFFSISGSEFVEMFVGVGAARVRDLFKEAKEKAPSIIFIDEIDAIGKKRSPGIGGGHDEREQTLNQILTEMDGFDNDTNVIIMAATNRADVLDKALLRPGRFDRKITINLPNLEDRIKILEVHAANKPIDKKIDLRKIASATVGFSGADLANLLNEAAILAGKLIAKSITEKMIQQSIEKILMGTTKKSLKMTEYEKKLTAYHEVGHAIVGKMLPNPDPVHKISILSRGGALGVTWFLPEKDKILVSKAKYVDEIATLYGGRVSEEIFFGKDNITTGASNDIQRATEIARAMVMRFGFDEELGAENFVEDQMAGNFLESQGKNKIISEKTQEKIDEKVRDILRKAYSVAKDIVFNNKDLHEKISAILVEKEEILREEFDEFFTEIKGVPEKNI